MLITLAIIGVVAALTIPTVLKNYNDKKYNTARLKALKTFGEAGKMASINGEMNGQASAKDFVNNVLSKYLKITKVCDTAHECGFPHEIQPLKLSNSKLTSDDLSSWSTLCEYYGYSGDVALDTQLSTYATTADGFSAKIFYNPKCIRTFYDKCAPNPVRYNGECDVFFIDYACMNVVYDMNGIKAPNHVGEDIAFVTVFWSGINSTSASPGIMPFENYLENHNNNANNNLTQIGNSSWCAQKGNSKIQYSLPSIDELSSLALNRKIASTEAGNFWSGTLSRDGEKGWAAIISSSRRRIYNRSDRFTARCVRR